MLERAEAVSRIQEVVQQEFGYTGQNIVGRGMSAVTLVKDIPEPWPGTHLGRSAYNRLMHESKESLLETDYLDIEDLDGAEGTELWRVSLRLGALNNVDYGQFVSSLRAVVQPVVAAYRIRHEAYQKIVESSSFEANKRGVGKVLVLGYSPLESETDEATTQEEKLAAGLTQAKQRPFDTLVSAMDKVFISETTDKPSWHSPELNPLKDGKATSDRWAQIPSIF